MSGENTKGVILPLYQCHKQVRAAKITGILKTETGATLCLRVSGEVVDHREVSQEWLQRNPQLTQGGYFVEYLEGDGYTSYSPAGPFESGYTIAGPNLANKCFDFGIALCHLKAGRRVARRGWNGKGMWLALSPGVSALDAGKFWAGPNREYAEKNGGVAEVLPCITMKTADGSILMGWLASQSDMLATDWEVV